jgi:hypothetical protein
MCLLPSKPTSPHTFGNLEFPIALSALSISARPCFDWLVLSRQMAGVAAISFLPVPMLPEPLCWAIDRVWMKD